MKQKFLPGQRVFIKDLSSFPYKSHFPHSMEAIVNGSYSQLYHDNDIASYSLYLLDSNNVVFNISSWYDEDDLVLINADMIAGFELAEEFNLKKL